MYLKHPNQFNNQEVISKLMSKIEPLSADLKRVLSGHYANNIPQQIKDVKINKDFINNLLNTQHTQADHNQSLSNDFYIYII